MKRIGAKHGALRGFFADVAESLDRSIKRTQLRAWQQSNPEAWANESHAVAVKLYADVPEDGPPPKLGREYVEANGPIVAEQLKRGGVRLAMVLNLAAK